MFLGIMSFLTRDPNWKIILGGMGYAVFFLNLTIYPVFRLGHLCGPWRFHATPVNMEGVVRGLIVLVGSGSLWVYEYVMNCT